MGSVATSFYTPSNRTSIFRRFHLSYKAQKEKKEYGYPKKISCEDRHLFYFCLTFRRRIPAVSSLTVPSEEHAQTKCPSALSLSLQMT